MNKGELVEAISQKISVSKKETDSILTAMLEEIVTVESELQSEKLH